MNFDIRTDSSLDGFETVEKLVVYAGVMCFNPIPVFTPLGIFIKLHPLPKSHILANSLFIFGRLIKLILIHYLKKKYILYSFVPDYSF